MSKTKITNEKLEKQVRDQIEGQWRKDDISNFDGFFLRKDGKVEVEQDSEDSVKGEYYESVEIMNKEDAWDILLDSEDFRAECDTMEKDRIESENLEVIY